MNAPPHSLPESIAGILISHLGWPAISGWGILSGGRSNSAWRLTGNDGATAVLKLYRSQSANPLFPNDPAAEALLLTHLEGRDVAPRLIAAFETPLGNCTLYEELPGTSWQTDTAPVADLMKDLHQIAPPVGLRRIGSGSVAVMDQARAILSDCSGIEAIEALAPRTDVAPTSEISLLHGDIVPGNLINHDGTLRLIDWQCPAVGDVCEDMAIFLSPAMQLLYRGNVLSAVEHARFLETYGGAPAARFTALQPAFHYRMAAYCLWHMQRDRPDYEEGLKVEIEALKALL